MLSGHYSHLLRLSLLPMLLLACLGLAGCPFPPRIYRIDVQQGQYITPDLVCKIKRGMSKETVINIMGTPTLCPTQAQRLDYYYYLKPGDGGPIQQKYLSIFFVNNRVHEIQTAL